MNASVSNELTITGDDPQQVLSGWLDDYIAERCDLDDLHLTFVSVVKADAEASWVALALLDQYQRLGRIDSSLATSLKANINQLVFGRTATRTSPPLAASAPAMAANTQQHEVVVAPRYAATPDTVDSMDPDEATLHSSTPDPAPAAQSRRILRQRYELLEPISSAATGTLYRALDRQRLHLPQSARHVAVHIIRLDDAKLAVAPDEFLHELYRAQSLAHPNIRSIFDVDRDGDTCFAVLELLDGEALSSLLQNANRRPMPWRHTRSILQGIGAALIYVHERGCIHGNLRPDTVMITESGEVKLLEYGFTHLHRREPWTSERTTSSDAPDVPSRYSSTGQLNTSGIQPGDDVFNLACIAYQMLSGRHPCEQRSTWFAKLTSRPPRSAWFNQHQWRVLRSALHLNPDNRRITMPELLAGLGCEPAPSPLVPPATMLADRSNGQPPWLRPLALGVASLLVVLLLVYGMVPTLPDNSGNDSRASEQAQQQPAVLPSPSTAPAEQPMVPPAATAADTIAMPAPVDAQNTLTAAMANAAAPAHTPALPQAIDADDTTMATGTVTFKQDSFVAVEDQGPAQIVLRRTGAVNAAAQVRWSLAGDSAMPVADYADLGPGIVEIPAGVREYTLMIPLASDAIKENTELFLVSIERVTGAPQPLAPVTATVIIVDDD